MFPATDLDNHLVEVPAPTGARTAAAKIDGDQSAEFQEPASYGLVRYINATFGQQVLDITKRQGEPSVKPDRVLDNLRRKLMSLERYLDHPETVAAPDRFGHRLNVSMPLGAPLIRIFDSPDLFHRKSRDVSVWRSDESAEASYELPQ